MPKPWPRSGAYRGTNTVAERKAKGGLGCPVSHPEHGDTRLFLGPEIVRIWRGQTSFTIQHPWVVAFAFGLLHGFGFASGLSTIGMPKAEIPLALLMFNVGVELGQLAFVILMLLSYRALKVLQFSWPRWVEFVPGYVIGSLGAYWTIQRTVMMF